MGERGKRYSPSPSHDVGHPPARLDCRAHGRQRPKCRNENKLVTCRNYSKASIYLTFTFIYPPPSLPWSPKHLDMLAWPRRFDCADGYRGGVYFLTTPSFLPLGLQRYAGSLGTNMRVNFHRGCGVLNGHLNFRKTLLYASAPVSNDCK